MHSPFGRYPIAIGRLSSVPLDVCITSARSSSTISPPDSCERVFFDEAFEWKCEIVDQRWERSIPALSFAEMGSSSSRTSSSGWTIVPKSICACPDGSVWVLDARHVARVFVLRGTMRRFICVLDFETHEERDHITRWTHSSVPTSLCPYSEPRNEYSTSSVPATSTVFIICDDGRICRLCIAWKIESSIRQSNETGYLEYESVELCPMWTLLSPTLKKHIIVRYVAGFVGRGVVISDTGQLYQWEYNPECEQDSDSMDVDVEACFLDGSRIIDVLCADGERFFALTEQGTVWASGSNRYGLLGIGSVNPDLHLPWKRIQMSGQEDHWKLRNLSVSTSHTLMTDNSGLMFAFGSNSYHSLGCGSNLDRIICSPWPISESPLLDGIISIAAGIERSACCTSNGDIFIWGRNYRFEKDSFFSVSKPLEYMNIDGLYGYGNDLYRVPCIFTPTRIRLQGKRICRVFFAGEELYVVLDYRDFTTISGSESSNPPSDQYLVPPSSFDSQRDNVLMDYGSLAKCFFFGSSLCSSDDDVSLLPSPVWWTVSSELYALSLSLSLEEQLVSSSVQVEVSEEPLSPFLPDNRTDGVLSVSPPNSDSGKKWKVSLVSPFSCDFLNRSCIQTLSELLENWSLSASRLNFYPEESLLLCVSVLESIERLHNADFYFGSLRILPSSIVVFSGPSLSWLGDSFCARFSPFVSLFAFPPEKHYDGEMLAVQYDLDDSDESSIAQFPVAPEILFPDSQTDICEFQPHRSDIWAIGILLFRIITGIEYWSWYCKPRQPTLAIVSNALQHESLLPIPSPEELIAWTPRLPLLGCVEEILEDIIRPCLYHAPSARPSSHDIFTRLSALVHGATSKNRLNT